MESQGTSIFETQTFNRQLTVPKEEDKKDDENDEEDSYM